MVLKTGPMAKLDLPLVLVFFQFWPVFLSALGIFTGLDWSNGKLGSWSDQPVWFLKPWLKVQEKTKKKKKKKNQRSRIKEKEEEDEQKENGKDTPSPEEEENEKRKEKKGKNVNAAPKKKMARTSE